MVEDSQWVQAGPGVTISINKPKGGVVLSVPTVEANGRKFSVLEMSVMGSEGVSFPALNTALERVALMGGLHGEPRELVAITPKEGVVYAAINYWNNDGKSRIASINNFGGGSNWPDLDVFLTNLTKSSDPGTFSPILLVDPSIKLKPYGQNKVDDSVPRVDNNPYRELEKFSGKEYDGSLSFKELEKFKGFKFGNGEWSYVYGVTHRGRDMGVTGFLDKLPKIGDSYQLYDSCWEIQAIKHDKFYDEFTGKPETIARKEFNQHLTLKLKHVTYFPPLPPSQQRMKLVEDDKMFWLKTATIAGYDLEEIEPQYMDKDPVTPWYEATNRKTGKKLYLGTRYRVFSISQDLGGGGLHISRGQPEEVEKYLIKSGKSRKRKK